jgi:hypothetical protein
MKVPIKLVTNTMRTIRSVTFACFPLSATASRLHQMLVDYFLNKYLLMYGDSFITNRRRATDIAMGDPHDAIARCQ